MQAMRVLKALTAVNVVLTGVNVGVVMTIWTLLGKRDQFVKENTAQ